MNIGRPKTKSDNSAVSFRLDVSLHILIVAALVHYLSQLKSMNFLTLTVTHKNIATNSTPNSVYFHSTHQEIVCVLKLKYSLVYKDN